LSGAARGRLMAASDGVATEFWPEIAWAKVTDNNRQINGSAMTFLEMRLTASSFPIDPGRARASHVVLGAMKLRSRFQKRAKAFSNRGVFWSRQALQTLCFRRKESRALSGFSIARFCFSLSPHLPNSRFGAIPVDLGARG